MRQGMDVWRVTGAEALRPYYLALLAEATAKVGSARQGSPCWPRRWQANDTGSAAGKPSCIGLKASSRWRT